MIKILRLGHRAGRDDRISTHVGLTARQWGADEVVFSGEKDSNMIQSQEDIIERWGGDIDISYTENWRKQIKNFDGFKVHLTMYGQRIGQKMDEIRQNYQDQGDILVVVGAEKVPRWVYKNVDLNISVGNQPHSEISALAVFLDRLQEGEIREEFEDAEIRVEPSEDRKITKQLDRPE